MQWYFPILLAGVFVVAAIEYAATSQPGSLKSCPNLPAVPYIHHHDIIDIVHCRKVCGDLVTSETATDMVVGEEQMGKFLAITAVTMFFVFVIAFVRGVLRIIIG
jgi:hypothetical protein